MRKISVLLVLCLAALNLNAFNVKADENNSVITQPTSPSMTKVEETRKAKVQKSNVDPLLSANNPLGITSAENSITKTYNLIQQNKLPEAKLVIEPAVEWLTNATEYHTSLYKVLKDVDNAKTQADIERDLALKFAILRDKAMYQLALLYIEEKKPQKAAEKLVNIVRSQPKTQLGFNAYQVLQQIGFTYKAQLLKSDVDNAQNNSAETR
jgi:hypothetical protein